MISMDNNQSLKLPKPNQPPNNTVNNSTNINQNSTNNSQFQNTQMLNTNKNSDEFGHKIKTISFDHPNPTIEHPDQVKKPVIKDNKLDQKKEKPPQQNIVANQPVAHSQLKTIKKDSKQINNKKVDSLQNQVNGLMQNQSIKDTPNSQVAKSNKSEIEQTPAIQPSHKVSTNANAQNQEPIQPVNQANNSSNTQNTEFQQNNHSQDIKSNPSINTPQPKNLKKPISFKKFATIVVLVTIFAVTAVVLILYKNSSDEKPTKQDLINALNPKKTNSKPSPTKNISDQENSFNIDITNLTEKTPWGDSIKKLAQDPETPDLQTLHQKYEVVRQALNDRDYQTFINNVSRETAYALNINASIVGSTKDGLNVSQSKSIIGEDFFIQQGPSRYVHQIPSNLEQYKPQSIETISDPEYGEKTIIIDHLDNKYLLMDTKWEYVIKLNYTINNLDEKKYLANNTQNHGYVLFVYDNNKWQYHSENWNIQFKQNVKLGDTQEKGKHVTIITGNEKNQYSPANVIINTGDKVIFKNVYGSIMTDSESPIVWNSPYMTGQTYEHIFKQSGIYKYQIIYFNNIFSGQIRVGE